MHYFFECPEALNFWAAFGAWWNGMTNQSIDITAKMLIIGHLENQHHRLHQALNICLIYGKWYIYTEKMNSEKILFYKFLCKLKYKIMIERIIATRNNQMRKCMVTWQEIEDFLT
jgi:hypothetical protein